MTEESVVQLMESSADATEWMANRATVLRAFDGDCPFWFPAIVGSGLAGRKLAEFGYGSSPEKLVRGE